VRAKARLMLTLVAQLKPVVAAVGAYREAIEGFFASMPARPEGGGRVRYYLGVDWADQTHAVWVVDERGTKVAGRTVLHTAEVDDDVMVEQEIHHPALRPLDRRPQLDPLRPPLVQLRPPSLKPGTAEWRSSARRHDHHHAPG
jgi:hypothetical protein